MKIWAEFAAIQVYSITMWIRRKAGQYYMWCLLWDPASLQWRDAYLHNIGAVAYLLWYGTQIFRHSLSIQLELQIMSIHKGGAASPLVHWFNRSCASYLVVLCFALRFQFAPSTTLLVSTEEGLARQQKQRWTKEFISKKMLLEFKFWCSGSAGQQKQLLGWIHEFTSKFSAFQTSALRTRFFSEGQVLLWSCKYLDHN